MNTIGSSDWCAFASPNVIFLASLPNPIFVEILLMHTKKNCWQLFFVTDGQCLQSILLVSWMTDSWWLTGIPFPSHNPWVDVFPNFPFGWSYVALETWNPPVPSMARGGNPKEMWSIMKSCKGNREECMEAAKACKSQRAWNDAQVFIGS